MKFYLSIIALILSVTANSQTVSEYVNYINKKGVDPKEYIFETFKKADIVILGERNHRDTTQYEFILDVLSDPRFAEEIGYVYTEVGVTNQTEAANHLIKGSYATHDDFHTAYIKFHRNMDYEILWEKYNIYKFVKGLYDINKTLPDAKKITWGLTDRPWDWTKAVYEGGEYSYNNVYENRDRIMADNFLRMYREQPKRDGRRKALIITNQPHADKSSKEKKQGYYITKGFREKARKGYNDELV